MSFARLRSAGDQKLIARAWFFWRHSPPVIAPERGKDRAVPPMAACVAVA